MQRSRRILIFLVLSSLLLGFLQGGCASEMAQAQPPAAAPPLAASVPQQPTEALEQLVAPIALYPDALVAQVLAAAASPTQIVEADRWLQQHADLKGDALAKAVDAQSWDPGVKALTQFPGLLGMMDKNLSWTSSLGEAYVNGPQNVLDAVQVMRQRAQQAGNLPNSGGGNAAIAYPAIYRSSGVMTIIATLDGGVSEKDLGAGTEKIAEAMTTYHADSTWTPVEATP